MRQKFYSLLCTLMLLPTSVFADWGVKVEGGKMQISKPNSYTDVYGIDSDTTVMSKFSDAGNGIITVGTWIFALGYLLLIGTIVYSGIKMATSVGNPKEKESARKLLMKALIGLALLGGVNTIVGLSMGMFGKV